MYIDALNKKETAILPATSDVRSEALAAGLNAARLQRGFGIR